MAVLYENISTVTPLIFVLSKGADPTTTLYKFAQERDFGEKINFISLG
jgi:dynein heavy chain